MLGRLVKRKIDANRLANVFVNSMVEISENGFQDLKDLIQNDPAFIAVPNLDQKGTDIFMLILVAGNMRFLDSHFEADESREIKQLIIEKYANIYDLSPQQFKSIIDDFDGFISRVNHPSKNTLYGMSKAIFHKLNLNEYQEPYFKSMKTPNPLLLKRLDELVHNFIWDWDEFFKRHKFQVH